MTGPGGENENMKGKELLVIIAIIMFIFTIQASCALDDDNNFNITQSDVQFSDIDNIEVSNVNADDNSSDNDINEINDSDVILVDSSSAIASESKSILGISNDNDLLGANKPWNQWTAGTLVYGVDYDTQYANDDEVPLERFFKAVFYGIRDYIHNTGSSVREWDVFLNNKTFTGGYGDAGVGTIQTGYNSYDERVTYLGMTRLAGYDMDNIEVIIHLYGGKTKDDGLTSTLDLTDYGASYSIIDFGTGNSSIQGINFKNFDVNDHSNTVNPDTTRPFIKLASNPRLNPDDLIKDCTFENITLNPKQPLYEIGTVKDLHFSNQYGESSLSNLIKFIFWRVRDGMKNDIDAGRAPTLDWNIFLDNNTFTGGYGDAGVGTISTGYYSWDTSGSAGRARYITFRNLNPKNNAFGENLNVTIHIYGGFSKDDGLTSTVDLTDYGADYRFIDLSGGSSTITGVNFVNFDVNKHSNTQSESTSMPFIFFGDEKIQNYGSSLINCTFENITLNQKQAIVRMSYMDSPLDSSEIMYSGGSIDGCTFRGNNASQMVVISGSPSDSKHKDDGPVFYGFSASNNLFENNVGTAEFDSNVKSLGLSFKVWNEAVNVTFDNNRFINNTNAVHGAAYCIIGRNVTISNNYIESNQAVYGAGVEAHYGYITIKDSVFYNNVAKGNHSQNSFRDGSGAAIALLGSNNYILNCTFIDNIAYGHAGVIDIVGSNRTYSNGTSKYEVANNTVIESSIFYNNLALDYAGAIHINGTNTQIINCTLEDNNASFAGAVRLIGENITIMDSSFDNNNAIQGGACYIEGLNSRIFNSDFTRNNATHDLSDVRPNDSMISAGGAIFIIGTYTNVTNNTFINNSANAKLNDGGLGGAIYINGTNITFNEDNFFENTAARGGAAYINGNNIYANIMNFTNNAAIQGGAVYVKGVNTTIENTFFNENNATNAVNPNINLNVSGGAVFIVGYNTNISNSEFIKNYAINGDGGAISIDGNLANIISNNFDENEAIHGGAIYIDSISTYSNIIDANFTYNNAAVGGAIFIRGSDTNIGEASFTNNNATKYLSFNLDSKYQSYNSMGGAIGIVGNNSLIYNSTFYNNTAIGKRIRSYGGAIAIQGYNTTLAGTDFEDNEAIIGGALYFSGQLNDINDTEFRDNHAVQGGAIYIAKSDATFGSSRFYNNSATHDLRFDLETTELQELLTRGGAINIPGNSIYVYDSEFINNTAYGVFEKGGIGGAIAVNGSQDYIINSTFENNHAIKGGAFYLEGENTNIINSNFTDNRAIQGGSGYIAGKYSLIEESQFNENYATHDGLRFPVSTVLQNTPTKGGAIHIIGENINISSSEFTQNEAVATSEKNSIGAGAIYIEGNYATINGSAFTDNTALKGGAIMVAINHTHIYDCNFTENSAFNYGAVGGLGGAVYLENASDSDFERCIFVNNNASVNGGAIDWHEGSSEGKILSSSFEDNSAKNNGGAVFWAGHDGMISDSNFTLNTADKGGAVFWGGMNGKINNSRFISNNASQGGAIYLQNCTHGSNINIDIEESYFENNTATNEGGAVNWNSGTGVDIKKSTFINNTANLGGAIFITGSDGEVIDSLFALNEAILGGAVYLNNKDLTVTSSDFEYNNAIQGGAIYMAGVNDEINNCNFNYNNATYNLRLNTSESDKKTKGGAIYIAGENNVIRNSNFYNNTACATNESSTIVQTTPGLLGAYLVTTGVDDDGLGGAIYIEANNNEITSNEFDYNVARNGSAIYNNASGTYFKDDLLVKNQAWSYVLDVNATPNRTYYGLKIEINLYNYVAGDNILNGIYNAKDVEDVTFNSVRYIIDDDVNKVRKTSASDIHPVLNAKEGVLYQDSLERYQPMVVEIYNESGSLVRNLTALTDLYGNHTFELNGLAPGNYSIKAYHPEDRNYKFIWTQNIFEILPYVDLNITKTVSDDIVILGDNITFTVIVSNAKNGTNATNVTVKDILPKGLVYLDINASMGTYNNATNVWTITQLNNGTSATLIFICNTTQSGKFNNTVIVSCNETEWNYTNNNASVLFEVTIINLTVDKIASNDTIPVLSNVTFTVTVTNNAKVNVTDVLITDVVPKGFEFVSCNDSAYNKSSGKLNIALLKAGESYLFNITLKALVNGTLVNVANATCKENDTVVSGEAEVNVTPVVNLTVVKVADSDDYTIGDVVTYTITVINNGPSNATSVAVNDILDKGLELCVDYSLYHVIPLITPGNNETIVIKATTTKSGNYDNKVNVSCAENKTIKSDNFTIHVYKTDLKINKTADVDTVPVNGLLNFTILVKNHGKSNATNVHITDTLDDAFEFVNATGNYTRNGKEIVWNVGKLANETSYTVVLTVRALTNGTFNNTAHVNCTEEETVKNSTCDVNVTPVVVLTIEKMTDIEVIPVNGEVLFTVIVTNNGPSNATGVKVTDIVPNGFEFVSCNDTAYNKATGELNIDFLKVNDTYEFTITLKAVTNGTLTNVANVSCAENDTVVSDDASIYVTPVVVLSVVKVADSDDFAIGDIVTYTITVINNGPSNATYVLVDDIMDQGLELCDGYTLNYEIPFIAAGENETIVIKAVTTKSGDFDNKVNVSCAENETIKSDNFTVHVYETDLKINKTSNMDSVPVNGLVNFTIVVKNHGKSNATNVHITDTLDDAFEFVNATGNYTVNGKEIVWNVGKLANETTINVVLAVRALTNGTFKNIAHVNCTEEETVKNSTCIVNVTPVVVLTIIKTADVEVIPVNGEIIFTVKVTNNGPSNATGVKVTDVIPKGFEFVSCNDSAYNKATGELNVSFLKAGESYVFTITLKAVTNGTLTNVANVSCAENDTVVSDDAEVNVTPVVVLLINKTADVEVIPVNGEVVFTVAVTNNGPSNATGVKVSDVVPSGFEFVSCNDTAYNNATGVLDIALLKVNDTYEFTITLKAVTNGTLTNVANVTCKENETVVSDDAEVNVTPVVVLSVLKVGDSDDFAIGDVVTYTITVTNNGPSNATKVLITDVLDEGLELAEGSLENIIPFVAAGESVNVTIKAIATRSGNFDNKVTVSCAENETVKSDNFTIHVYKTDLKINKTADVDSVPVNGLINYTIHVKNHGKSNATNIHITDTLDEAFDFVNATGNYTRNGRDIIWTLDNLENETSFNVVLSVRALTDGKFNNIAHVNCSEEETVKNSTCTITVTPVVNLAIEKMTDIEVIPVNGEVLFTVKVTNNGPSNATGVKIMDVVPKGFEFVSCNGSDYNESTGELNVAFIKVNDTYVFTITLKALTNGTLTNIVNVTCSENDTVVSDDASVKVTPVVNLSVVKIADSDDFVIGDIVTYTITITNNGPSDATDVKFNDVLDEGLELTSGSLEDVIPFIASGKSVNITIQARTTLKGNFDNKVTVSCAENDTVKSSNFTVHVYRTDLKINKTANVDIIPINGLVNFTIVVKNHGKSNATNVHITDTLVDAFEFVNATGNYTRNGREIVWNIGSLANETSYSVVITVRASTNGTFENIAHVNCSEEETVKNSTCTITVTPPVILNIEKIADVDVIPVNGEVIFTVKVTNNCYSNATNVLVSDPIPEGFEFVSCNDSAYDKSTGKLNISLLKANESYAFTITLKAITNGTLVNVANVNCSENDTVVSDDAKVNVTPVVSLTINKIADVNVVLDNGEVTFTINVTNNGPSAATGVKVTDVVPNGFEFVSCNDSAYDKTSGELNIALINAGESFVFNITLKTTATGTLTNIVNASCKENETVVSDDANVTVIPVVILTVEKTTDTPVIQIGDEVVYTINVTNHGPADANHVRILDVVPDGLEYVQENHGVHEHITVLISIPLIKAGESETVKITMKSLNNGTFTNKVYVYCNENDTRVSGTAVVNVTPIVNLNISKVANLDNCAAGDVVIFNITVSNNGPSNATGVKVSDVVPNGFEFVSCNDSAYDKTSGVLNIALLKANESYTFTLTLKAVTNGTLTNIANATCKENETLVSDDASINVTPVVNLVIDKTSDVEIIPINSEILFTVKVTNNGPSNATGVKVSDVVPNGFEFVSCNDSAYDKTSGVLNIALLKANESYVFTITLKAITNGTLTNVADVTCAENDTVVSDNADVKVINPQMAIEQTAIDEFVYSGEQTGFVIRVTNTGDSELTGVFAIDEIIPDGLIYDHFIGSNWTFDGSKFYYNGSLGVGDYAEFTVIVNTTLSGNFTSIATGGSAETGNCSANASVRVYTPDILIREISNNPYVVVGTPVSFTVIVTNTGDCPLTGIYVVNQFPEGLIYTGYDGKSEWEKLSVSLDDLLGANMAGSWTKEGEKFYYSGTLMPGESSSYLLFFDTPEAGTFTPEVVVNSDQTRNDTQNAYSNNTTVVVAPQIKVVKEVSNKSVNVGELITFIITVTNIGDWEVADVFVSDEFPEGLKYISFAGDNWIKEASKFIYGRLLAKGESAVLSVTFNTTKAGNFTNTAVAGSNMTANVTASVDFEVVNNTQPVPEPEPVVPQPENATDTVPEAAMPATGNPVVMLLLVIMAIIPLRRRKQ